MAKGKTITGEVIKLKRVRLSFPNLDEARAPKGVANAKESFGATALLDPTDTSHKELYKLCVAEINRLRQEAWGGKHPKEKPLECIGKGDNKTNDDGEVYKGYEGMIFISGKSDTRPLALTASKKEINDPKIIASTLYGGCYVDMNINFWVQDNEFGKAIRCGLRGVRFREDGEAFGGGRATADEFDDVEEGEGLDGLDDLGFD